MAEYCMLDAGASNASMGVRAIDESVAVSTVNDVEPLTVPRVPLIVAVPGATAVTIPLVPGVLLTFANAALLDAQVTSLVMVCVLPSLNEPVAMKDN